MYLATCQSVHMYMYMCYMCCTSVYMYMYIFMVYVLLCNSYITCMRYVWGLLHRSPRARAINPRVHVI